MEKEYVKKFLDLTGGNEPLIVYAQFSFSPPEEEVESLITADAQGGQSSFTFSDVRENTGIPDSAFRFTIPRGVDVVTHGQVRR